MRRMLVYIIVAAVFLLFQGTLLPLMFDPQWRPNVVVILVMILGVRERPWSAMMTVLFIGALQDSMGGSTIGLHISVCLAVFILIRLTAERLNVESPALLVLMLIGANIAYGLLVAFFMATAAELTTVVHLLISTLLQQTLSTLVVFLLVLVVFPAGVLGGAARAQGNGRLHRGESS